MVGRVGARNEVTRSAATTSQGGVVVVVVVVVVVGKTLKTVDYLAVVGIIF